MNNEVKFCKKCGEQLKKGTNFCEKCGNQYITTDEPLDVKIKKNNRSKTIGIVLSVVMVLIIIGSLAEKSGNNSSSNTYDLKEPQDTTVGTESARTKKDGNIDVDIDMDDISAQLDDLKITQLKSAEIVYVVYDEDKGIDTPYCRIENRIEVSDSDKYVPNSTLNGEFIANLKTKPFSQSEFIDYLTKQKSNGITEICYWEHRQQNGFFGNSISVDKYLEQ